MDSLSQRLERVEQAVFGPEQFVTPHRGDNATAVQLESLAPLAGACAALVTELQSLSRSLRVPPKDVHHSRADFGSAGVREPLRDEYEDDESENQSCPRKRARHEAGDDAVVTHAGYNQHSDDWLKSLLTPTGVPEFTSSVLEELLEDMLDLYFTRIQPWIPMLHEQSVRSSLNDPADREPMTVVLRAMTAATLRYLEIDGLCLDARDVDAITKKLKNEVLLEAMTSLSIRNVQALIIMAFIEVSFDYLRHRRTKR